MEAEATASQVGDQLHLLQLAVFGGEAIKVAGEHFVDAAQGLRVVGTP